MWKTSILNKLPCRLPSAIADSNINVEDIARSFEANITRLSVDHFVPDALWRDLFLFTGSLRTFYGNSNIHAKWTDLTRKKGIQNVQLDPGSAMVIQLGDRSTWVQAIYSFETTSQPVSSCKAILSLVPGPDGVWRIWLLRTILDQLHGYPDVDRLDPLKEHVQTNGTTNGAAKVTVNGTNGTSGDNKHFDCVVVGAGQSGLAAAGRLKALGLSYVLLERNQNVGDNWKLRYDSMRHHTPRDYGQLPFEKTFTAPKYPKFLSKDDLAEGYSDWANRYGINIWLGTTLESGAWDTDEKCWKLNLNRKQMPQTVSSKHIIIAVGGGGTVPKMPAYPGLEDYKGTVVHTSRYKNAKAWAGKAGIVIGSATSGHDVALDMVEAGCSSVTMVQRSPTYVFAAEYYEKIVDMLYNDYIPQELSDMLSESTPMPVVRLQAGHMLHERTRNDPERYDGLERAGFKLIRYGDAIDLLYDKFGGHHMDIGAVAKINSGDIKIKSDALPVRYSSSGLVFDDGTEIDADAIVFATGFHVNMKDSIREVFGSKTADRIDDFWGLDSEGEIKGVFKPTGDPHLWMMGGSSAQARYYSRFVALSILADLEGKTFEVYRD